MLQVSNENLSQFTFHFLAFAFICLSCTISTPQIARFEIQTNWIYNIETQKISNFISVFVMIEDLDPQRIFPRVTLHMTGYDLFWEIPISNEDIHRRACSYSAGFLYTPENLPAATYELRVHGERGVIATQRLSINQGPMPSVSDFPLLHNYRVSFPAVLFVYHQKDFFLATYLSPSYVLPKKEKGESFYLYSFSDTLQAGLVCGPY